jgi:hypothetical protein
VDEYCQIQQRLPFHTHIEHGFYPRNIEGRLVVSEYSKLATHNSGRKLRKKLEV